MTTWNHALGSASIVYDEIKCETLVDIRLRIPDDYIESLSAGEASNLREQLHGLIDVVAELSTGSA